MITTRLALLAVTCVFCLAACGSPVADPHASSHVDQAPHATRHEVAVARAIAASALRDEEADISSATFVVRDGTVQKAQANVGPACTSGRLIEVKLIGTFPHIATTGYPVRPGEHPDFTVTALNVTADATSGRPCLSGVQTGVVKPEPGAAVIALE